MNLYQSISMLLTSKEKQKSLVLIAFVFISMLLEVLSVGAIVPAIILMSKVDFIQTHAYLEPYFVMLGSPSQGQLLIDALLFLCVVYLIKTVFFIFMAWQQNKFYLGVQSNLSSRLFLGYLEQPWVFHLQRNSAELIQNIMNEVGIFTSSVLQPALVLVTEILVLFSISVLLFIFQPLATFALIGVLGIAGYGFQQGIRSYLVRLGKARQVFEKGRIQQLQQGLGGAKEVKLFGCEKVFSNLFDIHNEGNARLGRKQRTLLEVPRLWLELLIVSSMTVLVLVLVGQGFLLENLLAVLGLFAAAALRIMPSANRILSAVQNLHFGLPAVDKLHQELKQLAPVASVETENKPKLSYHNVIQLEQISYQYPDMDMRVLNNINLTIKRGFAIGFVGSSGAGKSTLIDIILGLLSPTEGVVKIDGVNLDGYTRDWQSQVGYVPQSIFLTDDSLRCNIAFGIPAHLINEAALQSAIRAAQLDQFIETLPDGLNTLVGERGVRLSGGQRQRIGIARALYHDPEVLVLDEATSALDMRTESEVMEAINALHGYKTLIIIAHRLSTVAHCDYLYRIEHGKIVREGTYSEVVHEEQQFEQA